MILCLRGNAISPARMRGIGSVAELRCEKFIYVASLREAVYVLHAFEKKTQKTAVRDLAIARTRFRAVVAGRQVDDGEED